MGQNQHGQINSMFEDWKVYSVEQKIFINYKTNELAEQHLTTLKKIQQLQMKKRMEEHHNFIAKILYYEPVDRNKLIQDQAKYYVYTEKLYPLCHQLWVPINSALSILKGYRRLSSNYGLIRVSQDMIKVNTKKEIKVWINKNLIINDINYRAQNQQQMLVDIVKIVMEFDSQTGALMANCYTLNQAINNILQSISESKSILHFSSRTTKKQDKPRVYQKQSSLGNNKNNVRSTKQTQDDSLKPFNDSTIKQISNSLSVALHQQKQQSVNYLQGITTLKSPTYINVNKVSESPSKIQANLRKDKNDISTNSFNYSQQNNAQKQSLIQFNNTQPQIGKLSGLVREYKPVEYRHQNYSQDTQSYNSANRLTNNQNIDKISKQNNKYKQIVYKPYQPGRKSNLTKTDIQKTQPNTNDQCIIRPQNEKLAKGSFINQNSDINTSREFNPQQNQNKKNPFTGQPLLMHFDSARTKTQEFYTSNVGTSSRLKTNFINTNTLISKYPTIQNSSNPITNIINEQTSEIQLPRSNRKIDESTFYHQNEYTDPQPKKQKQKQKLRTQPPEEERRQMKLRQAQKIKQQMCNLGIINNNNNNTKSLISQKSVRDLLIKQRVQEKNKKHAELKSAITKLLNE